MTDDRDYPDYWESLAERVTAGVLRRSRQGTLDWLADSTAARAMALVLASAAAIAVATALRSANDTDRRAAVVPTDSLGTAVLSRDEPPQIGALLLDSRKEAPR